MVEKIEEVNNSLLSCPDSSANYKNAEFALNVINIDKDLEYIDALNPKDVYIKTLEAIEKADLPVEKKKELYKEAGNDHLERNEKAINQVHQIRENKIISVLKGLVAGAMGYELVRQCVQLFSKSKTSDNVDTDNIVSIVDAYQKKIS